MKFRLKYWESDTNETVLHEKLIMPGCIFTTTCISKNALYLPEDTTKDSVVCQTIHKPKFD